MNIRSAMSTAKGFEWNPRRDLIDNKMAGPKGKPDRQPMPAESLNSKRDWALQHRIDKDSIRTKPGWKHDYPVGLQAPNADVAAMLSKRADSAQGPKPMPKPMPAEFLATQDCDVVKAMLDISKE
jgi:hypothetical protein